MNQNVLKLTHPRLHKLKAQYLPSLSEDQRIAVYLRFWENLSIQEIANFLNIKWSKADSIVESALNDLFEMIVNENNEPIAA